MIGIIPAAGAGSRIQPLAFSKELLPVGSRFDGAAERPRAVSEYLVERMVRAGATRLCIVISPGKSDILEYYGREAYTVPVCYVVQPSPRGFCDAVFCAAPFVAHDEPVLVGLPDTIWFPTDALARVPFAELSFVLFPVSHPEFFDAVVLGDEGRVAEVQVKQPNPSTHWIWGAFGMPSPVFADLHALWKTRECQDEYWGTLVNAYLGSGGTAYGYRVGTDYVDVGTLHGYRDAMTALDRQQRTATLTPESTA